MAISAEVGYVKLSRESIKDLVRRHFDSLDDSDQRVMVAIAFAESGAVVNIVHDNFVSGHQSEDSAARYDFGLWQVNSQHGYNRKRLLSEPDYNAGSAAEIHARQGFGAWVAWKSGAFKDFMVEESETPAADSLDPTEPVRDDWPTAPEVTVIVKNLNASFLALNAGLRSELRSAVRAWAETGVTA